MVKRLEGKLASLANIHCARNLEQKTAALQSGAGRGTQSRDMPWLPCLAWVGGGGGGSKKIAPAKGGESFSSHFIHCRIGMHQISELFVHFSLAWNGESSMFFFVAMLPYGKAH